MTHIPSLPVVKAHAYGNDFLLARSEHAGSTGDRADLARRLCDRHRGLGADGLLVFDDTRVGADTELFNADGSRSELSGNGVRCMAAWIAQVRALPPGTTITIGTGAGPKQLSLLERAGRAFKFRAAMGPPEELREETIDVAGTRVTAVVMRVGNPQCVVLGPATPERLATIAAGLAVHPRFPEGTNVELATVEAPDRVRILIWERGVGPTEASGTGASAAAVAAAAYGGAQRDVNVVAPGGTQRVEWMSEGIWLTGWAEIIGEALWWDAPRSGD
jgi:diaminopimelate epimerase